MRSKKLIQVKLATVYCLVLSMVLGLAAPDTVCASGFETYTMYGFDRVDVRDCYSSDEVYANFRALSGGSLGENVLLRGSSPVDPSLNRSDYVDRLLEAYRVNCVINLADTDEMIEKFRASELYHSWYYDKIQKDGGVLVAKMPAAGYETQDFCRGMCQRLAFIASRPGPYFIHCKEGKDRSAFACMILECLMGVDYGTIAEDYVKTFESYTRDGSFVKKDELELIRKTNVDAFLGVITGYPNETDFTQINLAEAAERYLKRGGVDDKTVALMKRNLSKSFGAPDRVHEGNCYAAVFDADYYMKSYPEAAWYSAGDEGKALEYFVKYGMDKWHMGSANFDASVYLRSGDVLIEMYGMSPKMYYYHYIRHGQYGEGPVCDDPMLYVTRLYRYFLSREPDSEGLVAWTELMKTKRCTGAKAVYGFVYSREYQAMNISDGEFVSQLYRIIFGREPDREGLNAWLGVLNNCATRKKVLEGFLNSDEMRSACMRMGVDPGLFRSSEYVDINYGASSYAAMLYREMLGRRPEADELEAWTYNLTEGGFGAVLTARNFMESDEFTARKLTNRRFVECMYRALLGREATSDEIAARVQDLKDGFTRRYVMFLICETQEFKNLCQRRGIAF